MTRLRDLERLYSLLHDLERRVGELRVLANCSNRMNWPLRGIYFFFEPNEARLDSGSGLRVVRVGTHALISGAKSTLWQRLSQHRGQNRGGGNHRGSIFRLLVGQALIKRDGLRAASWGIGSDVTQAAGRLNIAREAVQEQERPIEIGVSSHIGRLPFLWLSVDDPPDSKSDRGLLERNCIGLLSNYGKHQLDPPSQNWLGSYSEREKVRSSNLWNNNHVDESYDPDFFEVLERHINSMT